MSEISGADSAIEAMRAVIQLLSKLEQQKQHFVLKSVAELLGLSLDMFPRQPPVDVLEPIEPMPPGKARTDSAIPTIKDFVINKKPGTDAERVTCLAFFLTHMDGRESFATSDLSKANQQARLPPLSNAALAVRRAAKAGLLTKQRDGALQLSALGETFTHALPDRSAAKASLRDSPMRARGAKWKARRGARSS